jgi:hypothetical protein
VEFKGGRDLIWMFMGVFVCVGCAGLGANVDNRGEGAAPTGVFRL